MKTIRIRSMRILAGVNAACAFALLKFGFISQDTFTASVYFPAMFCVMAWAASFKR